MKTLSNLKLELQFAENTGNRKDADNCRQMIAALHVQEKVIKDGIKIEWSWPFAIHHVAKIKN